MTSDELNKYLQELGFSFEDSPETTRLSIFSNQNEVMSIYDTQKKINIIPINRITHKAHIRIDADGKIVKRDNSRLIRGGQNRLQKKSHSQKRVRQNKGIDS